MERSNYEAFMDCLNPMIQITRAILCGVVLWEKIQECDALGIPYTEIDTEDAAREVDRRLAMEREYLYVLALKEWAEAGLSSRTIKTDEAAADKGGCTTDQTICTTLTPLCSSNGCLSPLLLF